MMRETKTQGVLNQEIHLKMLFRFALPTILSMVFLSIYTSVDGMFVARFVNTNALSAVNIVMPLVFISSGIGTMFGSGGNALVAKKLGEGKIQEAREDFSLLSFCRTVVFLVIPVLALPLVIGLDGVWASILVGELLSLIMSIYYFMKMKRGKM